MKIAMLTNNYKPFIGGVPISIERLANGLEMLGHTVALGYPHCLIILHQPQVPEKLKKMREG